MNRRSFVAGISALGGILGLRKVTHASEKPCDHPLIMDFLNDNPEDGPRVAARITRFFELIDTRTGEPLRNPDGYLGVYFADELTGVCRTYKHNRASTQGQRVKNAYAVIIGTDRRPSTAERYLQRDPSSGCQLNPPLEIAWEEFTAPIRFVPRKGKEKEAAELRKWYAERERACGTRPAIPVVREATRFPRSHWDAESGKTVKFDVV